MPRGSKGFTRLAAIVAQRCPRCLEWPVFATLFRRHARCPACGLRFEREPGYFTGAMDPQLRRGDRRHRPGVARDGVDEIPDRCKDWAQGWMCSPRRAVRRLMTPWC
jgi:hypothetical protein